MKRIFTLFFAFSMLFTSETYAAKPIENLINIAIPVNIDGTNPDIKLVREAIIAACRKRGWSPVLDGDNVIKASTLIRSKHYAEIEIPFNRSSYSVLYKSSKNLDFNEKKQKIHRNYNKWVILLSNSIQREFVVRNQ